MFDTKQIHGQSLPHADGLGHGTWRQRLLLQHHNHSCSVTLQLVRTVSVNFLPKWTRRPVSEPVREGE